MKILIVEDEPSLLDFLESLFSCQHDVRAFVSSSSAAVLIDSWQPDLLICDLGLPDVTGEELAQAARRLPRPARIVLMSGDWQRLERARPLAAGVLFKPFRVQDLMTMVGPSTTARRKRKR